MSTGSEVAAEAAKGMVPHSSRSAFDCDFPASVGVFEFACVLSILKLGGLWFLAGPSQQAKEIVSRGNSRSLSLQASGTVTANIDDLLVQGSGKHGIVFSSFPARKVRCARVGPVQGGQNSIFLMDYYGHTRVIRCHDYDLIHDVVGYDGWHIYVTLHGHILDLSDTLSGVGVSDTPRVHHRLRGGSNNTDVPGQWQCGDCAATR